MSNQIQIDSRRDRDSRETQQPPAGEQVAVRVARLGKLTAFAAMELALRGDVR